MQNASRFSTGGEVGFTLVELVCVIVILGALSAVAVPRYIDMSASAHRAAVNGVAGAFASGLVIAFAGCLIKDWANKDNLPGYGNGNIDFNSACYPTDTNNQNTIANNNARCARVWTAILSAAPTVATNNSADYRARAQNNVCTYSYLVDGTASRQFTYNSLNGLVVVTNP